MPRYLGLHPPPVQRRSTSLPVTRLSNISENGRVGHTEREQRYLGTSPLDPRPGCTKIPVAVPGLIFTTNHDDTPKCRGCDRNSQAEGPCTICEARRDGGSIIGEGSIDSIDHPRSARSLIEANFPEDFDDEPKKRGLTKMYHKVKGLMTTKRSKKMVTK